MPDIFGAPIPGENIGQLFTGMGEAIRQREKEERDIANQLLLLQKKAEIENAIAQEQFQNRLKLVPEIMNQFGNRISGGINDSPTQVTPSHTVGTQQVGDIPSFVSRQSMNFNPFTGSMNVGVTQVENPLLKERRSQRFNTAMERKAKLDQTKIATGLRKEFRGSKVFKDFQEVNRSANLLEDIYKKAISPDTKSRLATDQALGVLFNKMLDPESVVREGEFARTEKGVAFINRMAAIAPQLAKGGMKLLDEDRLAIIETARQLLASSQDLLNQEMGNFELFANELGVEPKMIFGNMNPFTPKTQQQKTGGQLMIDANGNKAIVYPDGSYDEVP